MAEGVRKASLDIGVIFVLLVERFVADKDREGQWAGKPIYRASSGRRLLRLGEKKGFGAFTAVRTPSHGVI